MALIIKQSFISQSKSGREVITKDSTGTESQGASTGYGSTNGTPESILAYYFVVSKIYNSAELGFKIDGSNPSTPTPQEIAYGAPVTLTTGLLEDSGGDKHLASLMFTDGVLDVNMYVEFAGLTGVQIIEGTNFITGGVFTNTLKGDAVVVNDVIYQIDKSKDTNGDTVLYITGYFREDASEFGILYRSNIKVLLTAVTDSLHQYACKRLQCEMESREWDKVNIGLSFKRAAEGFFKDEVADFMTAEDLMTARYQLLCKFAI